MKCVAKNSYFIVVHDVCSTRKHQEYSTSTGFQGWVKRRRPVWINGSHLERLCQAPPPPWCPGESEDLLIWLKKCTNGPLHKIQKVKTIWRRNVDFTLRNPWGRGYGAGGLTLEFAGFVLELFLWTLETFHFCIWMFRFKSLFLYGWGTYMASILNNFLKISTIPWKVGEILANPWS